VSGGPFTPRSASGQVVDGESARLFAAPSGNPNWPVPSLMHRLPGFRTKVATGIGV